MDRILGFSHSAILCSTENEGITVMDYNMDE
jgi:hypothetical protein